MKTLTLEQRPDTKELLGDPAILQVPGLREDLLEIISRGSFLDGEDADYQEDGMGFSSLSKYNNEIKGRCMDFFVNNYQGRNWITLTHAFEFISRYKVEPRIPDLVKIARNCRNSYLGFTARGALKEMGTESSRKALAELSS